MTTIVQPLNTEQAALRIGKSVVTLRIWRCQGKGPRFTKLGEAKQATVVYQLADVEAWLESNTFNSTSAYSAAGRISSPKPLKPATSSTVANGLRDHSKE